MKTIRLFSSIITVGLLLSITTSCSDDNKNNDAIIGNQAGKLFSQIKETFIGNSYSNYITFEYDGKKLMDVKSQDAYGNIAGRFVYTYPDNNKVKIYSMNDGMSEEYTLNKKKYIEFLSEDNFFVEYLYNSSGYLIEKTEERIGEIETTGRTFTFTYKNGNKTRGTCTYYIKRDGKTYSESPITYTYSYLNRENKSKIDIYDEEVNNHLFYYSASGLYGKASKNLVEKIVISQGTEQASLEFRYVFDSDIYVVNIIEFYTNYTGENFVTQYDISY